MRCASGEGFSSIGTSNSTIVQNTVNAIPIMSIGCIVLDLDPVNNAANDIAAQQQQSAAGIQHLLAHRIFKHDL